MQGWTAPELGEICGRSPLSADDIATLSELSGYLPTFSALVEADIFIDILDRTGDFAWVVAQARPLCAESLYRTNVVGEPALRDNEPGVMACLETGSAKHGSRGVSQEGIPVAQSVVPIRREGRVIGALIMERNISDEVKRETQVQQLEATTDNLAETLLQFLAESDELSQVIADGLLLVDEREEVIFANRTARELLAGGLGAEGGEIASIELSQVLDRCTQERGQGSRAVNARIVPVRKKDGKVVKVVTLRDVTDLRQMQQELLAKDTYLREIHHRVKNNLQTMASLLRLQARRAKHPETRRILEESVGRIFAMASVHETLLAQPDSQVEVGDVLRRIVANVGGSTVANYRVEVLGDPLYLSQERAMSLALCLNELVQNALDHAFTGRGEGSVVVRMSDRRETVVVEVVDDGVGMPPGPVGQGSFGLQIVRSLVEQDLHGSLEISGQPGVRVEIAFPK